MTAHHHLAFHPVTPDRWPDLDRLFSAATETNFGTPGNGS